jgi:hypothetical protein
MTGGGLRRVEDDAFSSLMRKRKQRKGGEGLAAGTLLLQGYILFGMIPQELSTLTCIGPTFYLIYISSFFYIK